VLANGSVYWLEPEKNNIRFRAPKDELYANNPRALSAEMWYSIDPYIDGAVRLRYFEKIVMALYEAGFPLGPWAERVVSDIRSRGLESQIRGAFGSSATGAEDPQAEILADAEVMRISPDDLVTPTELVREYAGYRIHKMRGLFYAVPERLGEISLIQSDRLPPDVLVEISEDAIIDIIDNTLSWSNARGIYDTRIREKRNSTYIMANASTIVEENREWNLSGEQVILAVGNNFYAIPTASYDSSRRFIFASSKVANFEVRDTIGQYTLLEHDLVFYAVPNYDGNLDALTLAYPHKHGIIVADDVVALRRKVRAELGMSPVHEGREVARLQRSVDHGFGAAGAIFRIPTLVRTLHGYKIVSYEGVIFGIPPQHADVDFLDTDIDQLDGVIRDVSIDVVENEINYRASLAAENMVAAE
jgi:hypothetical protein